MPPKNLASATPKRAATTPAASKAPKRTASTTTVGPQAAKRAKSVTLPVSSDSETESPSIISKATTVVKNLVTPKSITRRKKNNDSDDDEDDVSDDAQVFSRGFFRALGPATDAYYNKQANLIRLQCAEYDREKDMVEAKIRLIDSRKAWLMALRESEAKYTGQARLQFRKARADEAAEGIMLIEKELKTIELSTAKYEHDIEIMRRELADRKEQAEESEEN
ncbi:hypothetical protein RSOL_439940, partial [Rhizoctonia solani AG-3 Rhs1AP]